MASVLNFCNTYLCLNHLFYLTFTKNTSLNQHGSFASHLIFDKGSPGHLTKLETTQHRAYGSDRINN